MRFWKVFENWHLNFSIFMFRVMFNFMFGNFVKKEKKRMVQWPFGFTFVSGISIKWSILRVACGSWKYRVELSSRNSFFFCSCSIDTLDDNQHAHKLIIESFVFFSAPFICSNENWRLSKSGKVMQFYSSIDKRPLNKSMKTVL